jgi:cytochrome c
MEGNCMSGRIWKWVAAGIIALGTGGALAKEVDVGAAEKLVKKSGCARCHLMSVKKVGPAFKAAAEKYKDRADAEQKLFAHLTTGPTIEVFGNKERHITPKTEDEAEIRNLVRYVLTR